MHIATYLRALRRWAWLLLSCSLVAGLAAAAVTSRLPSVYEAQVALLVKPAQPMAVGGQGSYVLTVDQVTRTYAQMMVQRPVLQQVIDDLRLRTTPEQLSPRITVTPQTDTTIIDVAVRDTNRFLARTIANQLVNDFVSRVREVQAEQTQQYVAQIQDQVNVVSGAIAGEQARADDLNSQAAKHPLSPQQLDDLSSVASQLNSDRSFYSALLRDLTDIQAQSARDSDNLLVLSPAIVPRDPVAPRPRLSVALAVAAALALALAVVLLLEHFDQSIKSDEDLTARLGVVPLGHIRFAPVEKTRRRELVSIGADHQSAEAFKSLRTNILFSGVEREVRTVVITSAGAGEGKSRVASNLGVVLAEAGHRTLVVDADLRRPSQHRIFGRLRNVGLTNLMLQDVAEDEVILPVESIPNLFVLTSGACPPNPSELLGSARMRALEAQLRSAFDFVIWDTPPVNAVTDATLLAAAADGVVLVVEQGRTTVPALGRAKAILDRVGARLLGGVLNKVRSSPMGYYYYQDYYGHPNGSGDGSTEEAEVVAAAGDRPA